MKKTTFVSISNDKKTLIKMSAIALCLAYFVYQSLSVESGVMAYIRLTHLMREKQNELENIKAEFTKLARRVELLSKGSLDIDLLEERCRVLNNLSLESDCIVKMY